MPAMAAASVLALMAGSASAAQMSGTIGGRPDGTDVHDRGHDLYRLADQHRRPALSELQAGDEVEVFYAFWETETEQPYNAMTVTMIEEAGGAGEVSGEIEDLDTTASTFVVEDRSFVVPSEARGTQLSDLREGDQVIVVYDAASAGEPIQVITLQKMN